VICYDCMESGGAAEAVAICVLCGTGLCRDHLVCERLPVHETVPYGLGERKHELPLPRRRFLCQECYRAVHQAEYLAPVRPSRT
jgi:hypothetical protein